ncbi:hypothetical protein [Proteus mirabilis]|uniref:hypothetical protein n=1 Tax=Proteus mirabilis TaxID=584 RepID=UPI0034D6237B
MLKDIPQFIVGKVADFRNIHNFYGFSIQNIKDDKFLSDLRTFLYLVSGKTGCKYIEIDFIVFTNNDIKSGTFATFDRNQNQTCEFNFENTNLDIFVPYLRSFLINYL